LTTRYRNVFIAPQSETTFEKSENREFGRLLLVVVGLFVGLALALELLVGWLVPKISYGMERDLARQLRLDNLPLKMFGDAPKTAEAKAIEVALQARVDTLHRALRLPSDLKITAHYSENKVVNAVATMGGHITVFKGLLQKLESNDELDAVLAHEMGHVQHRHVLKHMNRGIGTVVALNVIGLRSNIVNQWLVGDLAQLTSLAHSREAEREADTTAREALLARYGHTKGVVALFEQFKKIEAEKRVGVTLEVLHSHPLPESRRTEALRDADKPGALTPLDAVFLSAKKVSS
jgi:beta-barrel assembly-enhancing protease